MLYLFAGEPRKADVRHYLQGLCDLAQVVLEISEVDICRDPGMDLLDETTAKRALQQIRDGSWDVVIVTPPCNTFSRVRFVQPGPRPVRSRLYPLGFPWLSDNLLELARQGNQFIDFSFQVCFAALDVHADFLLEHPEDLGRTRSGHTPASIWQLEDARRLFSHEQVFTFAVYQCGFLAKSPKPTRFLTNIKAARDMPFSGPPRFDKSDGYAGPLPRFCGHKDHEALVGMGSSGQWKTTPAAAYPPLLCKKIAEWAFSVFDGGGAKTSGCDLDTSGQGISFHFNGLSLSPEPTVNNEAEGLAVKALRSGLISEAQLLALSLLLPDEDRVRESDIQAPGQRSFTTGAFCHHGRAGLRKNMGAFPYCSQLFARLVTSQFPGEPFTSLALFRDICQPPHKDTTNGRFNNLLLACSTFRDGGLWIEDPSGDSDRQVNGRSMVGRVLTWSEGRISFDPHRWHATERWSGISLVLAAYSIAQSELLSAEDKRGLEGAGFSLPGSKKRGAEHLEASEPSPEVEDLTYDQLLSGCDGPPMVGDFAGSVDEFVDGFGRCSPGRWRPANRGRRLSIKARDFACALHERVKRFVVESVPDLARATFRLATGRWVGPLFPQDGLDSLREDWFSMLPDSVRARELIPHQPFYLRAMAQTLEILEDPDFGILEEGKFCFCRGVEVGHLRPLGPTPQVFRTRRKGQKYDESEWEPEMRNYRDGPEVENALREAFEKEEKEGRMFPLSLSEARNRYPGESFRVAAQAVVPKPDNDFRVVHDGTHGVWVNNEIVMKDRLESPGAREVSALQKLGLVSEEKVFFGIVGDVSKAHRRFLHHPEHWGVLACKTRSDSSVVWLNRTGTFGIASAAYWFSRLIGLVGRLSFRVMLDAFIFALIYADDLHLVGAGKERWLNIWMMLALFRMQGTPFSDHKWRGGLQVDWVGYWIDYTRFHLGISEKRCQWIVSSIEGLEANGWLVDVRRFHELHGRLGFMSQVLLWIRFSGTWLCVAFCGSSGGRSVAA